MKQPNRSSGPAAHTTANDMDEALRRVQGRPAPTTGPRAPKAVTV